MSAARIAAALGGACQSGGWWSCRCPAHEDRHPSLCIRDGDHGSIVVHCFAGCTRRDIIAALRSRRLLRGRAGYLPSTQRVIRNDRSDDPEQRIAWAERIWKSAQGARGTPVVAYLASRGITMELPPALRWAPRCWHRRAGAYLPAMIAAIVDVAGELIGVHRTYLRPDGSDKANVDPTKAMLGHAAGGAVRLAPAAETLLIGEGIETCLAAMTATPTPAWAALSTSGMVALILPSTVRSVVIVADHDRSGKGERAAHAAAQRWLREGRRVRIALPPEPGTDVADVLVGRAYAPIVEADDVAA